MRILYLTYDGLADFIGQSQIIPYLGGCAALGHAITAISFEKSDRRSRVPFDWRPQRFHRRPPHVAKVFDLWTMRTAALKASANVRFDLAHARSYPAGLVGLAVKRQRGIPLIFDLRGFWADQRREAGLWPEPVYRWWKRIEAALVREADHLVVLTEAAATEIRGWPAYRGQPLSVIPCCADFDHFRPLDPERKVAARSQLGIAANAPLLAYLGSTGGVYRIDQHYRLFDAIKRRWADADMMLIGRDGIALDRADVPDMLGAADVATCFIAPGFGSLGVSPTKIGEYLACGIPVITNAGVGDVERLIAQTGGGHVMRDFSEISLDRAARAFDRLLSADARAIRRKAKPLLDLRLAIAAYDRLYERPDEAVRVP